MKKLNMIEKFEVKFLREAREFLLTLDEKTRDKILMNIDHAKHGLDPKLLKRLNSEIWEFRTKYKRQHFRILSFWDKRDNQNTLVIATHGFIKKSQKTPINEIKKAERIMKLYFEQY